MPRQRLSILGTANKKPDTADNKPTKDNKLGKPL